MLTPYTHFAPSVAVGLAVQRPAVTPCNGIGDGMKRPVVGPAREDVPS
jgi:hypothetical protein